MNRRNADSLSQRPSVVARTPVDRVGDPSLVERTEDVFRGAIVEPVQSVGDGEHVQRQAPAARKIERFSIGENDAQVLRECFRYDFGAPGARAREIGDERLTQKERG